MKKCLELISKDKRRVVGVLSGTSVDAVDVVLLEIEGSGIKTKFEILGFNSFPIEPGLKEFILKCSSKGVCSVEDICRLNYVIGNLFAGCINSFCKINNIDPESIDLIGSHGQTICHIPQEEEHFGFKIRSTLQTGDPSVIASLTGITTVGDFRAADVAVGGGGAPLIPYLDYILFKEEAKNKILLNIGGISNLSFISGDTDITNLQAFDTGPGNMLIDALMKIMYDKPFDKDGNTAASGAINNELLEKIFLHDSYYKAPPPKSTGREHYGKEFIEFILKESEGLQREDIIRTVSRFTAIAIYFNIKNYVNPEGKKLHQILVNGGGANNLFIMQLLAGMFPGTTVKKIDQGGINAENKEAILFAILANELMSGNKANVRSVTGASKNVFLGKICLA